MLEQTPPTATPRVKSPWHLPVREERSAPSGPLDSVQVAAEAPVAHPGGPRLWMAAAGALMAATSLAQAAPPPAMTAEPHPPKHAVFMWAPLTTHQERPTVDLLEKEMARGGALAVDEVKIPLGLKTGEPNPLALAPSDFFTGSYLVMPGETKGPIPQIDARDTRFFDDLVKDGRLPDVFFIGGHHVISEGWHNDEETRFLFEPEMLQTLRDYPSARKVFDNVKFAVLWGCNTMTDLEPHAADGSYLSPQQIESMVKSGAREAVLNPQNQTNNLRFYTDRLAREYGPNGPHYEYTTKASAEKCEGPGKYENCPITNLTRILPAEGLWDGTHRYDEPLTMKKIFPNAYLVLGFSSASPDEPVRARLLNETFRRSYADLHDLHVTNLVQTIIDPATPPQVRERVIETVRRHWTEVTYQLNRHRPSGSITPALPALDANGIFNVSIPGTRDTPKYAPYEPR